MGTETEHATQRNTLKPEDIVRDLRRVIRRGLPVRDETTAGHLAHLRSVVARATHPDDIYGRIDSLNQTLERLVGDMSDQHLGPPARILFGIADGTNGTTLTVRREKCAALLEYDPDHFRKRVENQILLAVAEQLHRDLVRYRARLRRPVTAYETSRPVPTLARDDVTREEELVSRIWQHLYEVRAERIATLLTAGEAEQLAHREREEAAALRLGELVDTYVETYGRQFISDGKLDYAVQGLEKLVVWKVRPVDRDS